jgi:CHC2 zinc finger/DNA polymerase family A
MPIIKRDFETRSAVNLNKIGARRYAVDPTTSVLCICFAVDDGPIESFVPGDGKPVPDVFVEAAHNPAWHVCAHNDPFESAIEEYVLGPRFNWPWVPIERHICTMAMARYHGLPGELGKVAALLDLPIQKDRNGTKLMLQLCRPRKPRPGEDPTQLYWPEITPEMLARLIVYCKNDVAVEREIFRRLPLLPDEEHRLWCLNRKINVRGFRGDLEFAHSACKLVSAEIAHINAEITTLTAGAVAGFTKLNDMREFVNARGHNMTKLNKRAVTTVLAHDPDDTVRTVLELRQASSNTAVAKYAAVLASAFRDQRIYGLLNYYGAHTGRWTSAGFNIHNLPREDSNDTLTAIDAIRRGDLERARTFGPPLEVIARLARGLVVASPDKLLLAGDFSIIEPRAASWFAEEKWKLDTFRKFDETGDPKLDAHRVVGARMRGQRVDPTDDEARQHGKTVHMALNYGGSVRVWREHVPDDPRSDEEIKTQEINKFRQLHPAQTRFMFSLDEQALHCVRYRQPVQRQRHGFVMDGDTLILRLPSGRSLFYRRAHLKPGRFGKNVVAYHNPAKNREDEMWYGAWLAHLVSATSRDLLVNALFNLDAAGFDIILHVHDEIVAEIDPADVEHDRERFKACMLVAPAWAKGLPLAAKVRVGPRYIKTDAPIEIKVESEASIVATEVASIQPQDGCLRDTEVLAASDFRTTELRSGPESEHKPVHAENDAEPAQPPLPPSDLPSGQTGSKAPPAIATQYVNGAAHAHFDSEISLKDIVDEPLTSGKVRCPFHDDTNPSCHIYDDHYHCFSCGAHGDAISWLMAVEGLSFRAAQEALACWEPRERSAVERVDDGKTLACARVLWDEAEPIAGTLAIDYLTFREIDVDQLTGSPEAVLRFHPNCPFDGSARVPCLLALYQDIDTDAFAGIHRIALTPSAFSHIPGSVKRRMLGRWAPL